MKFRSSLPILCTISLSVSLFFADAVRAGPAAEALEVFRAMRGAVPVPAGWDGIWDLHDSTYVCGAGTALYVFDRTETTCVAQEFPFEGRGTCTGSATSTTFHLDCSLHLIIDTCFIDLFYTWDGSRSGNTCDIVAQATLIDSPSGCTGNPSCTIERIHGIRTGDAPAERCATPTLSKTWGSVKATYR